MSAHMLIGVHVHRIVWLPGTDRLHGTCFCGAQQVADDPIALWEWLLAHPVEHTALSQAGPLEPRAEPAHV